MRNWLFVSFLVIVASMLIFVSCGKAEPATTAAKTAQTTAAQTTAAKTTTPPIAISTKTPEPTITGEKVVKGGILKRINTTGPTNIGYPPGGSVDVMTLERLLITDIKGYPTPQLAESWDLDPVNKTLVWHIRKGIKFSDGTIFDAKALKWNFEAYTKGGRMTYPTYIKSYEILDDYTLKMNLNDVNNQLIFNWGFVAMMSPTAFEKYGADWCRENVVTTAPYICTSFKRDALLTFVKNPDYWDKGYPYMDGYELKVIPDDMVCSGLMQTGDADVWATSSAQFATDLEKKGFKVRYQTAGILSCLLFDSAKQGSPFANKLVREAVEYALDRPAMAKMFGYGTYEPATQMTCRGVPGYIDNFDPRAYNPEKAKALLAQAGLSKIKTTLLTVSSSSDQAAYIKAALAKVGIEVDVDLADNARYRTAWTQGWQGLLLTGAGINPNGSSILTHFGPTPQTFRSGFEYKSPEYLKKCNDMLFVYTNEKYDAACQAVTRQASDDAMAIPIYFSKPAVVYQPYVHTTMGITSTSDYNPKADWMEAH